MNIMMFLQLAFIMATGALYLMSKKDINLRSAFKFCQRDLMLLIFFSAMNLSVSVSLFTNLYVFEVLIAGAAVFTLCFQMAYFLKRIRHYYAMEDTFNLETQSDQTKRFIAILLITKVISALCIFILREQTMAACCIILVIQLGFSIGFSRFRPYKKNLHNRALILVEWVATVFLCCNLLNKL
jgi:hypothetical protein